MKSNEIFFRMPGRVALACALGVAVVLCGTGAAGFGSAGQQQEGFERPGADLRSENDLTTFVVDIKADKPSNRQNNADPAEGPNTFRRGDTWVDDGTIYPNGSIAEGLGQEPIPSARKLGSYAIYA